MTIRRLTIDDATIEAWGRAIGLDVLVTEQPQEVRDAARAAIALSATLARLDTPATAPWAPLAS